MVELSETCMYIGSGLPFEFEYKGAEILVVDDVTHYLTGHRLSRAFLVCVLISFGQQECLNAVRA